MFRLRPACGEPEAELVELGFARSPHVGPALARIDVEGEAVDPLLFECAQEMPVQCDAVGVDDRLPTHLPDDPDQFDDVRVNERVPARDAHAVAFPEHPESLELTADLIEALVPEALQIPVTAFAAQVALVGRLEQEMPLSA